MPDTPALNKQTSKGAAPGGSTLKEVVAELTLENRLLKKSYALMRIADPLIPRSYDQFFLA